jgi:hypothetical protein
MPHAIEGLLLLLFIVPADFLACYAGNSGGWMNSRVALTGTSSSGEADIW